MKIYIVKTPQGEYEDYREPIAKVFSDKAKAEEFRDDNYPDCKVVKVEIKEIEDGKIDNVN